MTLFHALEPVANGEPMRLPPRHNLVRPAPEGTEHEMSASDIDLTAAVFCPGRSQVKKPVCGAEERERLEMLVSCAVAKSSSCHQSSLEQYHLHWAADRPGAGVEGCASPAGACTREAE